MNLEIKKYWEDQGKEIHSEGIPLGEFAGGIAYYYHQGERGPRIFIALPLAEDVNKLTYWFYPAWHSEVDMLNLIKA